jgi:glyoxylase-like metal-dependent hydrolase (beta-lactamase superfamily II)
MHFRQFLHRPTSAFSYLLACPETGRAVMIDPVLEQLALYLGVLDEMGWQLECILETHLHAEHITASGELRRATGAWVATGDPRMSTADRLLQHGDSLVFGSLIVSVLATPGHTACCLSYLCADRLFTGDCLLIGDCGHLSGEETSAGKLFDSIQRHLFSLPGETLFYPGHDQHGRLVGCIAEERGGNPLLCGVSRDEFIARMAERPRILLPESEDVVARNCCCGLPVSKSSPGSL